MTTPEEWKHGASAYAHGRCKCEVCRAANRERYNQGKAARYARFAADPTIRPHGDVNTYDNWGCRCRPCTQAATKQRSEERKRRTLRTTGKEKPKNPAMTAKFRVQPFGRDWLSDDKSAQS